MSGDPDVGALRLRIMEQYIATTNLLSTPPADVVHWIEQPTTTTPCLLGTTQEACLPVKPGSHRHLLPAAVWRSKARRLAGPEDYWLLTGHTDNPAQQVHLRVVAVMPSLSLLLRSWPVAGLVLWDWPSLTKHEESDVLLAAAR